jgi:hypothetical protein
MYESLQSVTSREPHGRRLYNPTKAQLVARALKTGLRQRHVRLGLCVKLQALDGVQLLPCEYALGHTGQLELLVCMPKWKMNCLNSGEKNLPFNA